MKAKSGKIIKICALSLGLLLVGGIAVSPTTKAYADGQVANTPAISLKKIKIEYTGDDKYTGAWLWIEGVENSERFVPFKDGTNNKIIETEIQCADNAKIGYIIADIKKNENGDGYTWGDKDESYVNPKIDPNNENEKHKINDRYITVGSGGVKFSLEEGTAAPTKEDKLKNIADKVNGLLSSELKAKDIRVWQGADITWSDALEKTDPESADDEYKEVYQALKDADVSDASNRNSDTEILEPKEGEIKLTFKDKSTLKLKNKLYVSNHITGSTNAPDDVVEIELKAGEGVNIVEGTGKDKITTKGDKDNPRTYKEYKAKPGTNINEYIHPAAKQTFLKLPTLEPQEGYQNPKWTSQNGSNFIIGKNNKVFTAKAVKKTTTPDSSKKPLVPSVKPSSSKSADYKIVPEKKTEKKVKPSEKVLKSYKNLRTSREKNVVAVKAAKLLLEIAPERVKDAKGKLEALITKSEGLVKQADTILEKLEAKYEF